MQNLFTAYAEIKLRSRESGTVFLRGFLLRMQRSNLCQNEGRFAYAVLFTAYAEIKPLM